MDPVEEIKSRLDIVDVISKHVELRRAGRNYKALCPFHQEKTPSFTVFPDTQTWRCFGACAEGGDVYSFLMKKNGWDFGETLRTLAEQTGVQLRPQTAAQMELKEAHARLYEVLEAATLYFMHLYRNAPQAEVARDYVVERMLLPHICEQFQIGYALDEWNAGHDYLRSKKFSDEEILAAGLLSESAESGRRYDRFRGRLMIPIRDVRGRVVGFGARTLKPDDNPKYLNSPQTDLFDKSTLLYGLDQSKRGIREAGQVVIVEGYMDVMQAHQAGFENIVAQMGTALTEAQLRQLKRYSKRLVLALDADTAGQQATLRGLNVARQTLDRQVEVVFDPRGLARLEGRLEADIRIVTLPAGYDPDKLIREDAGAWAKLIEQARPVVEFIIDSIVVEVDMSDAKSKSAAVNRALPIIGDVSNPVERDHYTQHLARKLQIDERTLASMAGRSAIQPARPNRRRTKTQASPQPPPAWDAENQAPAAVEAPRFAPPPPQELYCLHQILTLPAVWREADTCLSSLELPPISSTDFSDIQNRAIFAQLERMGTPDGLEEQIDDALRPRLETIHSQRSPADNISTEKLATHLAYSVLLLRKESAERDKKALDSAFAEDLVQADSGRIGEYSQQVLELRKRLQVVSRALELINSPKLTPTSKAA